MYLTYVNVGKSALIIIIIFLFLPIFSARFCVANQIMSLPVSRPIVFFFLFVPKSHILPLSLEHFPTICATDYTTAFVWRYAPSQIVNFLRDNRVAYNNHKKGITPQVSDLCKTKTKHLP